MTDWKPIETAPKDGTVIIGWVGLPWLFAWHREVKEIEIKPKWFWQKTKIKKEFFAGWHGVFPVHGQYGLMWLRANANQPTHWMPLPSKPKED